MKNTDNQIFFNFSYFALNLLGKNLYSTPLSAISELVANGLDAQASNVKLYIDMKDKEHSVIEILDNGTGMTYSDLANKYVFMGKNKRDELPDELKQSVMGRKGIGKLSALFLSKKYYIVTKTKEEGVSAWCLDTIHTNELETPSLQRCHLDDIQLATKSYFKNFKSGTVILLPDVNLVGIGTQSIEGLKANLSDYFLTNSIDCKIEVCVSNKQNKELHFETIQKSIAYKNMCAFIDNTKEDYSKNLANFVRYTKSKYDKVKNKKREVIKISPSEFPELSGEHEFTLEDGHTKINIQYKVEGWIGIHSSIEQNYATDNDERFIRNKVYTPAKLRLYIRKKLAVENFMELMGRTQALDNYIEGEISFDILDDDRLEDIATTNRQNLKPDDERVRFLVKILNPVLGRLVKERTKFGNQISYEEKAIETEIKRKQEEELHKAEEKAEQEKKAKEEAERKKKEEEEKRKKAEEEQRKAEEKAKQEEAARKVAEANLKSETRRANFLEEQNAPDKVLDALMTHIVKQLSGGIEKDVNATLMQYYQDKNILSKEDLIEVLEAASFDMALIRESMNVALVAGFSLKENSIKTDLYQFIKEYIDKVFLKYTHKPLKINFINDNNYEKVITFSPFELCLFLVNVIDNTLKYKLDDVDSKLEIICTKTQLLFKNNGQKLEPGIEKKRFFTQGFSTSKDMSSGLGLYHCYNIAQEMHASIDIIDNEDNGITLILELPNEN